MKPTPFTQYHKDGSIWAVGQLLDGATTGYWEWFRKDGTKSRSGYFENGHQVGEWTTYDKKGGVYKVTKMKEKPTVEKIEFNHPKSTVKKSFGQIVGHNSRGCAPSAWGRCVPEKDEFDVQAD